MITIWKKVSNDSWELVEELQDDLALAQRLIDLRVDNEEIRAEKRNELCSEVLSE